MSLYLLQGFLLGMSYVAPIGMQNLYVINSALSNKFRKAMLVSFITIFFDISLALVCFFGIGMIFEKSILLKLTVLLIGSIVVLYIGIKLIFSKVTDKIIGGESSNIIKVILSCFTVTWLNPQAIIDGSLLLGGFRVSLPKEASYFFILGSCIASLFWFTSITAVTSYFKNVFNIKYIKIINIICGIIISYYGLRLGYSFVKAISNF